MQLLINNIVRDAFLFDGRLVFDIRSSSQKAVTLSDTVLVPVRSCYEHMSPVTHRHESCWYGLSAGSTKGISISSIITGTDAASESLRLLRPSLLSLAGYFNSSDVRQNAMSALQVSCMMTCSEHADSSLPCIFPMADLIVSHLVSIMWKNVCAAARPVWCVRLVGHSWYIVVTSFLFVTMSCHVMSCHLRH